MTEAEALRYAIDWLRAFPALPTAAPGYAERRAAAVEKLAEMLSEREQEEREAREDNEALRAWMVERGRRRG